MACPPAPAIWCFEDLGFIDIRDQGIEDPRSLHMALQWIAKLCSLPGAWMHKCQVDPGLAGTVNKLFGGVLTDM